jgi:hypothetical protein
MAMAQSGRQRRVLVTSGLFHGSENHRVTTPQPNQQGLIPGSPCCYVPLKPLAHDRGALLPACQQPLHAVSDQAQRPAQSRPPLGAQESRLPPLAPALPSVALMPPPTRAGALTVWPSGSPLAPRWRSQDRRRAATEERKPGASRTPSGMGGNGEQVSSPSICSPVCSLGPEPFPEKSIGATGFEPAT